MPRGPATSKRQPGAANQRDTRHEGGLVGPGKKVLRSNGHLHGQKAPDKKGTATPPLPGTSPSSSNGNAQRPVLGDSMTEHKLLAEMSRKTSVDASSDSASDVYQTASLENHRQIDVNAAKNPAVHYDPLSFVLTVLWSCPLWDTLAILIVLLQLPPTFLSIIHLLFATLTFVPPSTAATSGLSFTDILQGTLGTPSVGTIFLIDVIVLMVWLFLWSPLQDIALDLAQTVIALTLGGGTSGKGAGMKNVLWCFSVIGVSHYFRGNMIRHSGLRAFMASNGLLGSPDPDDPLESRSTTRSKRHGLIRSILAIHILTQGVVRYIRDWYVRREKRDNLASPGDPEAGKALDSTSDLITTPTNQENDSSVPTAAGTPAAALKKKKRKSAQVRIRQPLWAALASTKIVMVKEYETSHTASESAGANATGTNNLGNAPFNSEADRIWITSVGPDEVSFSTSFFPVHKMPNGTDGLDSYAIDRSKPFYVKVNRTIWQPTRINSISDEEPTAGRSTKWYGVIVGLAPTSNYQCDFYSTLNDSIIFSARVRTLQSSAIDSSVSLAPGPQIQGRPGSPTTTLRTSIGTQQLKLAEEKKILASKRKEQRGKLQMLRREIDKLSTSLQTTGGNDDKQRQKIQQFNLNMRQAEEKIRDLESEIERLQAVPTNDTARYSSAKAEIQSQRDRHKLARSDFDSAKQAADREVEDRKGDLASLQQKCENKQSRLNYLNSKHESLTDANAKGLDEAQRKQREREAKRSRREKSREHYVTRDLAFTSQISEGTVALNYLLNTIAGLQEEVQHIQGLSGGFQPNYNPGMSSQSPEHSFVPDGESGGMNAGASPWNPTSNPVSSVWAYTPAPPPAYSPHANRARVRSSSMLSSISHFTESSSEGQTNSVYPATGTVTWSDAREEHKSSSASANGSRSGSGSGGSVGDPKSPM